MSRLTTPFGFHSTASEVIQGINLSGKQAIVTGGASGIGIETARALAEVGATVTLAVRHPESATSVVADLCRSTGNPNIHVQNLDLADLRSVNAFATAWQGPLHMLINNAGVMAIPELEKTQQGFEQQFGVNFLGHFALTYGLSQALVAAKGARVVSLSSSGHHLSPVNFDDLNYDFIPYTPFGAYGQSKTANALLAVAITRHWGGDGIFCNAVNPGAIATGLQKYTGGLQTPVERRKTPQQGAATSVLLAASPYVEGVGGIYFEDCNEAHRITRRPTDFSGGVAPYALDVENAERLWRVALKLLA
jgi:NAD(P)-dependent dehydrogenase (short-subunit alcohol dehydrogenase family)